MKKGGTEEGGALHPFRSHTVPALPLDSWARRCHSSTHGGTPLSHDPPHACLPHPCLRQNIPRTSPSTRKTNKIIHTNPKNPNPKCPWNGYPYGYTGYG